MRSNDQPDSLGITRKEARKTLDQRIEAAREIDDKAMRSVRTAVVLLAVTVSALGLASDTYLSQLEIETLSLGGLGIASLLCTVIVGTYTYQQTELSYGIDKSWIDDVLASNYTREEWDDELLEGYALWLEKAESKTRTNDLYLNITQLSMMLGVFCLAVGSTVSLLKRYADIPVFNSLILLAFLLLVSRFLGPRVWNYCRENF